MKKLSIALLMLAGCKESGVVATFEDDSGADIEGDDSTEPIGVDEPTDNTPAQFAGGVTISVDSQFGTDRCELPVVLRGDGSGIYTDSVDCSFGPIAFQAFFQGALIPDETLPALETEVKIVWEIGQPEFGSMMVLPDGGSWVGRAQVQPRIGPAYLIRLEVVPE